MQLFAASGLEPAKIGDMEDMSNGMGLFLQKTNIIRDYLEDIMEEPAPRFAADHLQSLHPQNIGTYVCVSTMVLVYEICLIIAGCSGQRRFGDCMQLSWQILNSPQIKRRLSQP